MNTNDPLLVFKKETKQIYYNIPLPKLLNYVFLISEIFFPKLKETDVKYTTKWDSNKL